MVSFVVSRDLGRCHICGHMGADSADHLLPLTERPDLAMTASNLKAVHSRACETCSAAAGARGGKPVYCNYIRGAMSVERARKIVETRTGLVLGNSQDKARGERSWD